SAPEPFTSLFATLSSPRSAKTADVVVGPHVKGVGCQTFEALAPPREGGNATGRPYARSPTIGLGSLTT
ncbi:hypothetical protein U1Q18_024269, partial [Sarracenia purpurea var. burkii]